MIACYTLVSLKKGYEMISPTGKGIRNDSEGSGEYGAPRGIRLHNGIDYECTGGQDIIAPFDMLITRISNPKANSTLSGIAWQHGQSTGKMFYFKPNSSLINTFVKESDVIGIAQSVSKDYGLPNMIDHIHFQID